MDFDGKLKAARLRQRIAGIHHALANPRLNPAERAEKERYLGNLEAAVRGLESMQSDAPIPIERLPERRRRGRPASNSSDNDQSSPPSTVDGAASTGPKRSGGRGRAKPHIPGRHPRF